MLNVGRYTSNGIKFYSREEFVYVIDTSRVELSNDSTYCTSFRFACRRNWNVLEFAKMRSLDCRFRLGDEKIAIGVTTHRHTATVVQCVSQLGRKKRTTSERYYYSCTKHLFLKPSHPSPPSFQGTKCRDILPPSTSSRTTCYHGIDSRSSFLVEPGEEDPY